MRLRCVYVMLCLKTRSIIKLNGISLACYFAGGRVTCTDSLVTQLFRGYFKDAVQVHSRDL